ncbi:hypothetical protein TorRG33x02_293500, partial [Trema orientale]
PCISMSTARDVSMLVGYVRPRVLKLKPLREQYDVLLGHAKHDTKHERTYL